MQHKKDCIFLGYSLGNSSVSDYFSSLAMQFESKYQVVIITDTSKIIESFPSEIIIKKWPSKRPTKFKDFNFLRQLVKKHKPKMMLSLFGANNLFLLVGKLSNVPYRIGTYRTLSDQYKSNRFQILRKKIVYSLATQLIVNSKATKDDLSTTFKVASSKIAVVPNAVRLNKIENTRDTNLIVYAGRLHESKGISILLKSFSSLLVGQPEAQLKILGGTKDKIDHYKKEAQRLNILSNTVFLGSVNKSTLLDWFSKARFVVVPSLAEAFGFVVIEAFSVGTPVIGSNTGGIKDSIRDGKDGFLVPPGNSEVLEKRMHQLLEDDSLVKKIQQNCYEHFLSNFELESSTQKLFINLHNQISTEK